MVLANPKYNLQVEYMGSQGSRVCCKMPVQRQIPSFDGLLHNNKHPDGNFTVIQKTKA